MKTERTDRQNGTKFRSAETEKQTDWIKQRCKDRQARVESDHKRRKDCCKQRFVNRQTEVQKGKKLPRKENT